MWALVGIVLTLAALAIGACFRTKNAAPFLVALAIVLVGGLISFLFLRHAYAESIWGFIDLKGYWVSASITLLAALGTPILAFVFPGLFNPRLNDYSSGGR